MFGMNDNGQNNQAMAQPAGPGPMLGNPIGSPAAGAPEPAAPSMPAPTAPDMGAGEPPAMSAQNDDKNESDGGLLQLKQQALQNLAPLVGHLDQTPEERFKTTMMLIQASDNQQLVKDAYEAANQITDEKARAQALLDVVNEINYFTHTPAAGENPPETKEQN